MPVPPSHPPTTVMPGAPVQVCWSWRLLAMVILISGIVTGSAAWAFAAGNANFVGTWRGTTGPLFTIDSQSPSGACIGKTALPAGYTLVDCHVSGDHFRFTITFGPSYRSYNAGVITGNTLTATFTDTNGTTQHYTGTRGAPAPPTRPALPAQHSTASSIALSLAPPSKAFVPLGSDLVDVAIAAGMVLFLTFPANLFNSTLEENHTEIAAWWKKRVVTRVPAPVRQAAVRLYRKVVASAAGPRSAELPTREHLDREKLTFGFVLLAGALLGSLLDPSFGINLRTLLSFVAIAAAMLGSVVIAAIVTGGYHRARGHRAVPYKLDALPMGLGIAAFCVLVSRAIGFSPGYLYGIICGVTFNRELAHHEEGHLVALEAGARVAVAIVAWLLWAVVSQDAAHPGSFFAKILAEDFFAALFVSGLVSTVVALLPLRFLPGYKLRKWHTGAWAATFTTTLFVLVQVILRPHGATSGPSHAPLVTAVTLFVLFGAGSVLFWLHFSRKTRDNEMGVTDEAEPVPGTGGQPSLGLEASDAADG